MKKSMWRAFAVLCTLGLAAAGSQAAEPFPTRPIHLLVPYAPGGSTDQIARMLARYMGPELGQPVIIDNKPGASGAIAMEVTIRAPADGYTLVFGNTGTNSILPVIRKLSYEERQLAPISIVAKTPLIWAVTSDIPVKTMAEFIDYARKASKPLIYGSTGVGAVSQLGAEYLAYRAGLRMTHMPFNGAAPAMLAMRRGDVNAMFVTGLDGRAILQSGAIRYLGIGSATRSSLAPQILAISETIPGFKAEWWFGVPAP